MVKEIRKWVDDHSVSTYVAEPDLSSSDAEEYARVAKAVGLEDSPALRFEMLERLLKEENIRCYDNKQVHAFLDRKLGKDKWHWAPLRKADCGVKDGWRDGNGVSFGPNQYNEPVPLPVLLTVQKVLTAMPDAHFYVSAAGDPDEDPFLYVTCGVRGHIIERWDEPDFRER